MPRRRDSSDLPPRPARTVFTVSAARFSACSSSAEACAKPVDVARHRAQAEALRGVERRALQLAVVERQALALDILEEQLAVVGAGQRVVDQLGRLALVEAALAEEKVVGGGEMVDRFAHCEHLSETTVCQPLPVILSAAKDLAPGQARPYGRAQGLSLRSGRQEGLAQTTNTILPKWALAFMCASDTHRSLSTSLPLR